MQVTVDIGNLLTAIPEAAREALLAVESQVLQDCNYFCLQDTGALIASSLGSAQQTADGIEVSWNTPYARRRYYEACNVSRDVNPNARIRWAEEAATTYAEDWARLVAKGVSL